MYAIISNSKLIWTSILIIRQIAYLRTMKTCRINYGITVKNSKKILHLVISVRYGLLMAQKSFVSSVFAVEKNSKKLYCAILLKCMSAQE